jgi:hypothetical protein
LTESFRVTYCASAGNVRDREIRAWRDTGALRIGSDSVEFAGRGHQVQIASIRLVYHHKHWFSFLSGADYVGVDFGEGESARLTAIRWGRMIDPRANRRIFLALWPHWGTR